MERIMPKSRWQHRYCMDLSLEYLGRHLDSGVLSRGTFRFMANALFLIIMRHNNNEKLSAISGQISMKFLS
jgi:hypothetical protein